MVARTILGLIVALCALGAHGHPFHAGCENPATGPHGAATAGNGGYSIVPGGGEGKFTLRGPPFRGFLIQPASGDVSLAASGDGVQAACSGVGHTSPLEKNSVEFTASGHGGVRFFVLTGLQTWYGPISATV